MFLFKLALDAIVFPALVSAVSLGTLLRLLRRAEGRVAIAVAFATGLGYLTVHVRAVGWPPLPPVDTVQWLFFVVALAAPAGVLYARARSWRFVPAGILFAVLLGTALNPMLSHHWEAGRAILWLGGLVAGVCAVWFLIESLEDEAAASFLPASFLWVHLVAAVVLGLSATALLSQLAAGSTASLAVIACYALCFRRSAGGALLVAFVILMGLLLNGYFYAQLTAWNAIFLAVSLPAFWLSRMPWVRHWSEWRRAGLGLLAVVLLTLPPLVSATRSFLEEPDEDYYEYGLDVSGGHRR